MTNVITFRLPLVIFLFFFSRPIDGNGRTRRTKELGKGLKIEAQLIIAIPFLSARSCVICAVCFFFVFFWPLRKIRLFICLAFFQKGLFFTFDFAGFFVVVFVCFRPSFSFLYLLLFFALPSMRRLLLASCYIDRPPVLFRDSQTARPLLSIRPCFAFAFYPATSSILFYPPPSLLPHHHHPPPPAT
jgi:hypothetical protein